MLSVLDERNTKEMAISSMQRILIIQFQKKNFDNACCIQYLKFINEKKRKKEKHLFTFFNDDASKLLLQQNWRPL